MEDTKQDQKEYTFLKLADMVNASIKAFCMENGLTWMNQSMEFFNSTRIIEGLGSSAGIKVNLTFKAYFEDEPYRSATGYGSKTAKKVS